jgi:hypothetical protein
MVVHAQSVAGAQQYNSSSSSSRRLQEHPRLPQSAPSGTQRDVLLMEPPQWLPDSYASHCGACQVGKGSFACLCVLLCWLAHRCAGICCCWSPVVAA